MLSIKNLHVKLEEGTSRSSKGVDLEVEGRKSPCDHGAERVGQVDVVLRVVGPRGYEVTEGSATLEGADLLEMDPPKSARGWSVPSVQYPVEIPGVGNMTFLRTALNAQRKARGRGGDQRGRFPQADPRKGQGPADRRREC